MLGLSPRGNMRGLRSQNSGISALGCRTASRLLSSLLAYPGLASVPPLNNGDGDQPGSGPETSRHAVIPPMARTVARHRFRSPKTPLSFGNGAMRSKRAATRPVRRARGRASGGKSGGVTGIPDGASPACRSARRIGTALRSVMPSSCRRDPEYPPPHRAGRYGSP